MSFAISKIFWSLAQPGNIAILALVLAAVLARRHPTFARRLLRVTVVLLLVVTFVPIGHWLNAPLERRFPELTDLPDNVDGIIVLGGAVEVSPAIGRAYLELNGSAERMTVSADVARRLPEAKLVYSGYKGRLVDVSDAPPDIVDFYVRNGVERSRIILEEGSRNTYENALLSKELVDPAPDETWLLITSANHMPRAFGVFEKLGWSVTPMPVDFRHPVELRMRDYVSDMVQPNVSGRLEELKQALKAWIGLSAYWLMGRTSSLLPGP